MDDSLKTTNRTEYYRQIQYQGPSPDEVTLVDIARHYGFVFIGSSTSKIQLDVKHKPQTLDMLRVFEFNSDRKRMSVIVRHNGKIKLYMKGADNMVLAKLDRRTEQPFLQQVTSQIKGFSNQGLRTLLVGVKFLTEEQYRAFDLKYQACSESDNREEEIDQLAEEIEQNIFLIGATGNSP